MIDQKKAMFTKRPPGPIPVVCRNHTPGQLHRDTITDGDSVGLRLGQEGVQINNVVVLEGGKFRGRINGFGSCELEYQGHKIDDVVEFEELHIFALHLP